jgi:hypothetical protein
VPRCEESRIEFDFNLAEKVFTHDINGQCTGEYGRDDNSLWPGVDFRLKDATGWIWLEVKNWRISARNTYMRKMKSKAFALEMREKFLGTAAFLASKKDPDALPRPLTLIFLFQPQHGADPALRSASQQFIRDQLRSALTPLDIRFAVLDIASWNNRFPDYPARQI